MYKNLFLIFVCVSYTTGSLTLTRIGSFSVKHPAFTTVNVNSNAKTPGDKYNLLISTFAGPSLFGSSDSVQLVRNVGSKLDNINNISPEMLTGSVTWPNEVVAVPDGIFTSDAIVIPDGFLVPFKTKGAIKVMEITAGSVSGPFTLSATDSAGNWFYHRVEWYDMDGDGDQDIVTCRAREPVVPLLFGKKDEELVWLENPSGDFKSGTWATHVLTHGPGVYFRFTQMNTTEGMKNCIFTAQFFTKSLSVYWTTQSGGLFSDASQIQSRVIDDSIGSVFEVEITDLNNDGKQDLLVTTNGANGTLLAYEIPDDFRTGNFIKQTIDVGFVPRQSGTGKGAPGSALTVHPTTSSDSNNNLSTTTYLLPTKGVALGRLHCNPNFSAKPTILLSGDDDGRAYSYEATSQDPTDWAYKKTTFCDAGSGTVGELSAADVDGDGYLDVFVPSYSTNEVFIYTYKPSINENGIMVG